MVIRRLPLVIALLAGAPLSMAQDAVPAPAPARQVAAAPASAKSLMWTRTKVDNGRNLRLQVAHRIFKPAKGEGPTVTLYGAVHIADKSFYDTLQAQLDSHDLVLFEGVSPPGSDDPALPDGDNAGRFERTKDRIRLVAMLLERQKRDSHGGAGAAGGGPGAGTYPASLDELQKSLASHDESRQAGWLQGAKSDGWSRPLIYEVAPDGKSFTLKSLGADGAPGGDGPDADQSLADQPPLKPSELGEEPGIQKRLASAFGLSFQLDSMKEPAPKWINADMTIDEVQQRLGGGDGEGESSGIFALLDGSSFPARMAGVLLGIVERMPAIAVRGKVMMVELLGNVDDALMNNAMPGGQDLMKVIIQDRNQVVVDTLARTIVAHPEAKRIAIVYGAGHMPDLSARLVDQLGYIHDKGEWITAIKVDLDAAGIDEDEIDMTRTMIRQQMEMLKKTKGGER